jgi:hypothetical protein
MKEEMALAFLRKNRAQAGLLALLVSALVVLFAQNAEANSFIPKKGKIYHGVSETSEVGDFNKFKRQVGAHPAVLQELYHWDVSLKASGAFHRWNKTDTLGMVSMSTKLPATGHKEMSPGQISKGRGDDYMLRLNESIAHRGKPVYIRLFPEMNGYWNPYCAFNASGDPRDAAHKTKYFKRAWQRFVMVVRGGSLKGINKRLRAHHMPRLLHARSNRDPVYRQNGIGKRLPHAKASFMWVPQTFGSPNIPGNQPKNYWPGRNFVDWVGADIFSKFSGAFPSLQSFYRKYHKYPFVIGEYSPWDNDATGAFTNQLFNWARSHGRVRMLVYYRSVTADNPYTINRYPGARTALRRQLNKKVFAPFAPQAR